MVFKTQSSKVVSGNNKMVLILESYSCGFWIKEKKKIFRKYWNSIEGNWWTMSSNHQRSYCISQCHLRPSQAFIFRVSRQRTDERLKTSSHSNAHSNISLQQMPEKATLTLYWYSNCCTQKIKKWILGVSMQPLVLQKKRFFPHILINWKNAMQMRQRSEALIL